MANTDFSTLLSGSAPVNRSGLLTALEKRGAYVVVAGENPASLTPGNVNVLVYGGVLFNYDSADSTTAHDGVTCIVTADGKRFKTDQFKGSNNALRNVKDKDLATPPGSPALGDRYIVAASGTGAWTGKDKQIAEWTARGWVFQVPNAFDVTMVVDEALYYHYSAAGVWTSGLPALTIADASISLKKLKYFPLGVAVENQTTNTPPGSPADGEAYIVGGSPTGAWVGQSLKVAIFETSAWVFYAGYEGAQAYDKALNALYTHNGATWATAVADPEVYLGRLTGSASATLNLTGIGAYKFLRIVGSNLMPATDGVVFMVRLSSDNGSNYLAANYANRTFGPDTAGTAMLARVPGSSDAFYIDTAGIGGNDQIGNAAGDGGLDFTMFIGSFNAAQKTKCISEFVYGNESGAIVVGGKLHSWHTDQTAMNAIRFLFSSGNIASGTIDLWGTP